LEIVRITRQPERKTVQSDGCIRLHGYASSLGRYLRVVLLADGETVHDAFIDEEFRP
jgi:hypothetical protein